MKSILLLLFLFVLSNSVFYSQGIFKTAEDFRKGNYLIKAISASAYKVCANRLLKAKKIKVINGDSTYTFLKSDIYGYQDFKNYYRFNNNDVYTILNPKETIIIYEKIKLAGPKGNLPTKMYFFSKNESSEILPFTIENLKWVFQNEGEFYDLIEIHYKEDIDLLRFDSLRKMYFINYLFNRTNQQEYP